MVISSTVSLLKINGCLSDIFSLVTSLSVVFIFIVLNHSIFQSRITSVLLNSTS